MNKVSNPQKQYYKQAINRFRLLFISITNFILTYFNCMLLEVTAVA